MYKFLKECDAYYHYQNNNSYTKKHYTREQADVAIKTLIDCWDCLDCEDCEDCYNCWHCYNCKNLFLSDRLIIDEVKKCINL